MENSVTLVIWIAIIVCITQSASFSGLNLACFSISKLSLEIEVKKGNPKAIKLRDLRKDANFLLATILWGNVAVNVLLALLSNSVLTGAMAFLFSTVVITFAGEILPQGYFSRHALQMSALLAPMLRFYQFILYPVAKPSALFLDAWLGAEAIKYFKEDDVRKLLQLHADAPDTDIDRVEGRGALNFLALDDIPAAAEGEEINPDSILTLDFMDNKPVFPEIRSSSSDTFLRTIQKPNKKWIIIIDSEGHPQIALNADKFLREALFNKKRLIPLRYCHRPIIIRDGQTRLGDIITRLKVNPEYSGDDVIDDDLILVWCDEIKRVITGSDILGRLLRGIVQNKEIFGIK